MEVDVTDVPEGITRLREARGSEQVTFDDVADHLVDFARRHPDARAQVDAIAAFLARVEKVPHEHDDSDGAPEEGSTVSA